MRRGSSRHDATSAGRIHILPRIVATSGLFALLSGCSIVPDLAIVEDVNARLWCDSASVVFGNEDTLARRTLRIVVRSNDELSQDTLTLRIATTAPDSTRYEELFTLHIPRIHKPAPLRRQTIVPYRTEVVLADTGTYRFTFRPTRPVKGIEAVGLHIAKN